MLCVCVWLFRPVELTFTIGENLDAIRGFEQAIMNMYKGEKSLFILQPEYGFVKHGNQEKKIPPNAVLEFEIELIAFEKV